MFDSQEFPRNSGFQTKQGRCTSELASILIACANYIQAPARQYPSIKKEVQIKIPQVDEELLILVKCWEKECEFFFFNDVTTGAGQALLPRLA